MKSIFQGAALAAFFLFSQTTARSDEFTVVPMGDVAYKQLALLAPTGWIETRSAPRTPLTRYEIATEAVRAYVTLRARREAGQVFVATPQSLAALRALREMAGKFQVELRALGVDAGETEQLCDELTRRISSTSRNAPAGIGAPRAVPIRAPIASTQQPRLVGSQQMQLALPLSGRLRFEALVSKLQRDARDPFGDTDDAMPRSAQAGVAFSLTNRVALRAFGGQARIASATNSVEATRFNTAGGGVSLALPRGVQLRGDFERLSARASGNSDWNRLGGELGFSAWENRLSLRANWSRMLPIDTRLLPSTASGVDVELGVSERLQLTLLYRQLFHERDEVAANRVVSGGINIKF